MATKIRDLNDGFCSDRMVDFWPRNIVIFLAVLGATYLLYFLSGYYLNMFADASWFSSLEKTPLGISELFLASCHWKVLLTITFAATNLLHYYDASKLCNWRHALIFYLLMKFAWLNVFYVMQQCVLGVIVSYFSWLALILLVIVTYNYSRLSTLMLLPYLLWETFFVSVFYQICMLNA